MWTGSKGGCAAAPSRSTSVCSRRSGDCAASGPCLPWSFFAPMTRCGRSPTSPQRCSRAPTASRRHQRAPPRGATYVFAMRCSASSTSSVPSPTQVSLLLARTCSERSSGPRSREIVPVRRDASRCSTSCAHARAASRWCSWSGSSRDRYRAGPRPRPCSTTMPAATSTRAWARGSSAPILRAATATSSTRPVRAPRAGCTWFERRSTTKAPSGRRARSGMRRGRSSTQTT